MAKIERLSRTEAPPSFPFSALVGQEAMKKALLLNVVDPTLGGVLIKGERGTAKSTGVRALIDLLPSIKVVENCPFQCDPDVPSELCPFCREKVAAGQRLSAIKRKIKLVNLPLGITEDRLLGTIDIEKALKIGKKAFEPGLLAEAHRGILYVDEVNLLNDQIVDLLLDAAASGWNLVEREGISFAHASRFILVGTMNPEEGDLRPQLLDRFGLSVSIKGIKDISERTEIIRRRLAFEADPDGFRLKWKAADEELALRVAQAKINLPKIAVTEDLLETAAKICIAMETDGHRADITMIKAARAHAALQGRSKITYEDLRLAARLVLPHRLRKTPLQGKEFDEAKLEEVMSQHVESLPPGKDWTPVYKNRTSTGSKDQSYTSPLTCVTHLCPSVRNLRPEIPWHLITSCGHPGKRFNLPNSKGSGHIHGSRMPLPDDRITDLSFIGTLSAAAPFQEYRGRNGRMIIRWEDLRVRKRSRKTGLSVMLIVDSSASMRTNDRMSITKGIISALIQDLYLRRDKLGIITFRHKSAELVLPLTHNLRNATEAIEELPVGGRTPLASALEMGIRLLLQEKRKNPETVPVMLLFSDGRPNVSCFGADPLEESLQLAEKARRHRIHGILVDTELDPMAEGYGYEIASSMGATYLPIDRLFR